MEYQPFYRLFVTPVLPFSPDGSIDELGYRLLLRRFLTEEYLDAGIAIIANPEAGELFTLDYDERKHVVEIVLDETAGRAPVLAGVVDVTTSGMIRTARDAADLGVDGLFVFPPIGAGDITLAWDPERNPEVWVDILKDIAAEVDLPMVLHPVARLSIPYGVGIPAPVVRHIVTQVPQVVGWKMTYNYDGFLTVARTLRSLDRPVAVLAAVGKYFHENLANGHFDGTSSGSFNYALEPMMDHIAAWQRGDVEGAVKLWTSGLSELQEYIFSDFSRLHIRYKAATWIRGYISRPFMRKPMPSPSKAEVRELVRLLQNMGVSIISQEEVEETAQTLR